MHNDYSGLSGRRGRDVMDAHVRVRVMVVVVVRVGMIVVRVGMMVSYVGSVSCLLCLVVFGIGSGLWERHE